MSRRFQFSLATIFWLTFLVPASYFVTTGFTDHFIALAVLLLVSFVMKRILERPRTALNSRPQAPHPLDDD